MQCLIFERNLARVHLAAHTQKCIDQFPRLDFTGRRQFDSLRARRFGMQRVCQLRNRTQYRAIQSTHSRSQ